MGDRLVKKGLAIGTILLFMCVAVTPTIGISNFIDDTTPPLTNISFDPPEPDGLNGWYISNVTVTLNATDDISGVKEIHYRIAEGEWKVHTGDFLVFILDQDCLMGWIEFYSVDNGGNQEEIKSVYIKIDQLPPDINLTWKINGSNPKEGWILISTTMAIDNCSGVQRIEFWLNEQLEETIVGPGPHYEWNIPWPFSTYKVRGLIRNVNITDENVNFYAIAVIISEISGIPPKAIFKICAYDLAGNVGWVEIYQSPIVTPDIYLFKNLTLPNFYKGYIGRYFIWGEFLQFLNVRWGSGYGG